MLRFAAKDENFLLIKILKNKSPVAKLHWSTFI